MTEDIELAPRRKNRRLINEECNNSEELSPIIGYAQQPLVSLADACKPLVDIVDNILYYVFIAIQTTPHNPADNLTRDESASIRLYTMEWNDDHASLYTVLNRALRAHDRKELRPWFKYLKLLLTALTKMPCAEPQTIWRGVRQNISDAFPRGAEVIWWSFSSCTRTLTVLESELYLGKTGDRTLFSIEVLNGKNVCAHSFFPNEDEILLLPGTYMEVRSQLNPSTDMYIIHLRQEIPKTMLLEPPFEGIYEDV
jgi:NAD:arginine ADP-ribosyltransferase